MSGNRLSGSVSPKNKFNLDMDKDVGHGQATYNLLLVKSYNGRERAINHRPCVTIKFSISLFVLQMSWFNPG